MMESGDPVEAQKIIPILVKYSRLMNGLFKDVQKFLPPGGTPRRVLYQAPPRSPSRTLYEAVGEVAVVHNPPTTVEPGEGSRPGSTGRAPERARSSQTRRKSLDGRVPSQIGPDGVNHLSAGPPHGLEPRTGPELESGDVLLKDALREREAPSAPVLSSEMYDAGSSSHHFQGSINPRAGASCALRSSGTTNQE